MEEHLTWNQHISHAITKINRGIGVIAKSRYFLILIHLRTKQYQRKADSFLQEIGLEDPPMLKT